MLNHRKEIAHGSLCHYGIVTIVGELKEVHLNVHESIVTFTIYKNNETIDYVEKVFFGGTYEDQYKDAKLYLETLKNKYDL